MASTRAKITGYSDELVRQATLSLETGTAVAGYDVDRLYNDKPGRGFRATDGNVSIQLDYAEKVIPSLLGIIHTTPEAGEEVRFMADNAANWAAPAIDVTLTVPGWVGAGDTRWPRNIWLDVSAIEGFDPLGYLSFLVAFGRDTPLAQDLEIGELRLHSTVYDVDIDRGRKELPERPDIEHRTSFGYRTVYPYGSRIEVLEGVLGGLDTTAVAELKAQWEDVGARAHPFLVVPDVSEADAFLVKWEAMELNLQRATKAQGQAGFRMVEVARGLRPGA